MTVKQFVKVPGIVAAFVVILLAGMFVTPHACEPNAMSRERESS